LALAEALELAEAIRAAPGIELAGVTTHLADSDNADDLSYTQAQLAEFNQICEALRADSHTDFRRHAANSAGTLLLDAAHFEFARPGLAIYGMWPSAATRDAILQAGRGTLQPVLTWKTRVVQIKTIQKGAKVGYGCTWSATRETRIAVLPIGYYDGYTRAYSNKAAVLIRGQRAPIVGRVCMNVCMVDVTDIPEVRLEDEVVLLGRQGEAEITAEELADFSGTINYEVTTRIRENIERREI
jgi:alanine racemase